VGIDPDAQTRRPLALRAHSLALRAHSLALRARSLAPSPGPRRVKLFVNEPTIDFGQASSSSSKPAFEFELDQTSLGKKDAVVALPVVKFRNVHTVTVFIENNQSGDDESTTVVSRIQLFGQSGDSFDVASIKDVSKEEAG
jgi:hypothetical protein